MSALTNIATPSRVQFIVSSTTLRLVDGTTVNLRPIEPSDVPALLEMHNRLSSDTVYYRYLHPYQPDAKELERLAALDGIEGAAFVAVMPEMGKERVIGIAYYETEAEDRRAGQPAILIEDEYQNQGIGLALSRLVIEHARLSSMQRFDMVIHSANRRMMHLIRKSGRPYEGKFSYGAYEVRVSL